MIAAWHVVKQLWGIVSSTLNMITQKKTKKKTDNLKAHIYKQHIHLA